MGNAPTDTKKIYPLRDGDTVLVEAVVRLSSDDPTSPLTVKFGEYGPYASVQPEQVHSVVRRFFHPGEEVIADNLRATVLAVDGDEVWCRYEGGTRFHIGSLWLKRPELPGEADQEPLHPSEQPPSASDFDCEEEVIL